MLYVKKIGEDSQMICNYHPDCSQSSEDYRWLESEQIYTPDMKTLLSVYPFKNVLDMNYEWWSSTNKPFDIGIVRNNAIDFLSNKYYNVKKLNEIVPLIKHKKVKRLIIIVKKKRIK
jgi:hypothetical protein